MLKGLVTAFRTLSIIPLPGKDASNLAASLPWFPVVGLTLGGIIYAIMRILKFCSATPWPQGCAIGGVVCAVILTKGLHLDGLSDWADGFIGGGWDKQKTLEVMKDPHSGVFGVISVVVILLVKWVCYTRLMENGMPVWIVSAVIISRTMQVESAATLPYARSNDGTGAPFVRNARGIHRIIAVSCATGFLFLLNGIAGFFGLIVGWIVCGLFGLWCKKRIGGITGDTLGACSEIVETVVLCAFTLAEIKAPSLL